MHLEGRLIAVVETLVLPAQPATGSVNYIPLGGDGFSAPNGAYAVNNFSLTGDATGGLLTFNVTMDNRYCSLVSYATGLIGQVTPTDAEFRTILRSLTGNAVPEIVHAGIREALVAAFVVEVNELWSVPPVILPGGPDVGQLSWNWVNADGDSFSLDALIYVFNIRVREMTPMGPLLWAKGAL